MTEIVKYNNELKKISWGGLKQKELDILIYILAEYNKQKTETIKFNYNEFKQILKFESLKTFEKDLKNMMTKIIKTSSESEITEKNTFRVTSMFSKLDLIRDNQEIEIEFNKYFTEILQIKKNDKGEDKEYTQFKLEEYAQLKGNYTKLLYLELIKWRMTGNWNISIKEFKKILGINENYKTCDINTKIINYSFKQFEELGIFKKLTLRKIKKGVKIKTLEFKFKIKPLETSYSKKPKLKKLEKFTKFNNKIDHSTTKSPANKIYTGKETTQIKTNQSNEILQKEINKTLFNIGIQGITNPKLTKKINNCNSINELEQIRKKYNL